MTTSSTLHLLQKSPSQVDLLLTLKDLKNVVIGNTWKKVEVAEDEELLSLSVVLLLGRKELTSTAYFLSYTYLVDLLTM